jgi:PIN domain nuclease of toxin-antitoxin system
MRALLDTHTLLWWLLDHPRLSRRARAVMTDPASDLLVSSASGFEIATKHRLGKLWVGGLNPSEIPVYLEEERIGTLSIGLRHALAAGALPDHHRDPFDRLLIAAKRARIRSTTAFSG